MPNSAADIQVLNQGLIAAAQAGQVEKVKDFLAQGADVNAKDEDGCTSLIHAILKKHEEILNVLLKVKGIDVNSKYNAGWTPLIYATQFENTDAFDKLLNNSRVDILAVDTDGIDALTYAGYSENEIAKAKIEEKLKSNATEIFLTPESNSNENHSSPAPELIGVVDYSPISL